jgi:hypothetical protein
VLIDDDVIIDDEVLYPAKATYNLGRSGDRWTTIYGTTANISSTITTTNVGASFAEIVDLSVENIVGDVMEIQIIDIDRSGEDPILTFGESDNVKFSQGYSYSGDYFYLKDVQTDKDRVHVSPSSFQIYDNSSGTAVSIDFSDGSATFSGNVQTSQYLIVGEALEIGTSLILDATTSNTTDAITTTKDWLIVGSSTSRTYYIRYFLR